MTTADGIALAVALFALGFAADLGSVLAAGALAFAGLAAAPFGFTADFVAEAFAASAFAGFAALAGAAACAALASGVAAGSVLAAASFFLGLVDVPDDFANCASLAALVWPAERAPAFAPIIVSQRCNDGAASGHV